HTEVVEQHVRRDQHADEREDRRDHAVERRARVRLRHPLHPVLDHCIPAHVPVVAPADAPVIAWISAFAAWKSFQFWSSRPLTNTVGVPRTPSCAPSIWFAVTVSACASLSRQLRN